MAKPFLTAEWRYLLNVTFPVAPELLAARVPPGVELDVQDGKAFASIVAFHFLNTRIKGLKIPFHVNFPEINLRFYVKHQGRRGVVFWKELVPKAAIAWVAQGLYNEPYRRAKMKVEVSDQEQGIQTLTHDFRYGGKQHQISAQFGPDLHIPDEDSVEHYFKEHDVGFGVNHLGHTLSYEVKHPRWAIYELRNWSLDMDYAALYGPQWSFLGEATPISALLAEGSAVEVYPASRLTS